MAFRTIDDCGRIVTAAESASTAVVLGGGLLGLEAARGLLGKGVDVTIVHPQDFPMDRQLDADGGAVLSRVVRGIGARLVLGRFVVARHAPAGDGPAHVVLDDGSVLPADLVVLAAGVRSRTDLAATMGLQVDRAVVVDDRLATSVAHVHAIGECAQHRGEVAGLVQPGWDHARVLADVLTGADADATYEGTSVLTRLKAPDIDLASMGTVDVDVHDPGHEVLTFTDPSRGRYAKLVLRQDRLVGAILLGVGDAAGALTQLYDTGAAVPRDRLSLMLGRAVTRSTASEPVNLAEMPGTAVICRCNSVTKAAVVGAFRAGADSVAAMAEATRATTGCGSCKGAVDGLCAWLRSAEPTPSGPRCPALRHRGQPDHRTGAGSRRPDRRSRLMSTTTEQPRSTASGTGTRTVVVIGHGMVGHRFVEAIRSRDTESTWKVVVLSEEADAAYDRVGLSSYVGAWDRRALALAGNSYAGDDLVELRLGTRAEHVDREARTVTTSSGEVIGYDSVVLATGSYPFVPPVPGHDSDGCYVYRTLDDLDGIRARAETAIERAAAEGREPNGLVVGGGLLGLEAANALRLLGLTPHVVEFAPRLMPLQVDDGGGAVLKGLISSLGVQVHTGAGTSSIAAQQDGRLAVELSDGTALLTDLVVFSAGVRPSDAVARSAGLDVGERGGVVTDVACRTSDENVWAIGEVAAVEGRCYGLVAPGYTMAEVVADRLLGGEATFPGADLSTKLKLLGVDVASFGDAMAATPGALEVVHTDATKGTYAKVVVSDDARTLLGGILVGDASAYTTLKAYVGREVPGDPGALVSPAGWTTQRSVPLSPTTPSSARATTSRRARSAARSPRAPATSQPSRAARTPAPPAAAACPRSGSSSSTPVSSSPRPCASTSSRAVPSSSRSSHRPASAPSPACSPATARAPGARSASRQSPRSSRRRAVTTSSTASRPPCRTATTTSSPTSRRTAPTPSCRACPEVR